MKIGGFFIVAVLALTACSGDPQPREPDPSATPTSMSTPAPAAARCVMSVLTTHLKFALIFCSATTHCRLMSSTCARACRFGSARSQDGDDHRIRRLQCGE
mgnify:CR=1 FL=1